MKEELYYKHMLSIALEYGNRTPALASYYMLKLIKFRFDPDVKSKLNCFICFTCGTIRNDTNCTVRLKNKIRQCKSVKKLLKKQQKQLTKVKPWQQRLLRLIESRNNRQVLTCYRCGNTVKQSIKSSHFHEISDESFRHSITVSDSNATPVISENKKKKKKRKKADPTAGIITSEKMTSPSTIRKTPISNESVANMPSSNRPSPKTPKWLSELQTPKNSDKKVLLKKSLLNAMAEKNSPRNASFKDFLI